MGSFDKNSILDLQHKLKDDEIKPTTEEATKQWIIMPFIVALGYNPYSSDIIPEYTLDVGIKKGEKVDYALQINNQPVALVECKQLNVQLSEKHISQLYRYFTISNVHIAILTNGDDYWFFTDSQKENVMDLEPYFKIKLSDADIESINKLEKYSKEKIKYIDIVQEVQCERFRSECKELIHGLKTHNIPAWLIDILSERSELSDIDRHILADYIIDAIETEFNGYQCIKNKDSTDDNSGSLGDRMKETMQKNKMNMSKIKLNHEYVYNDYSDGDWKFHTIDYAIIMGTKYENISGKGLLIGTIVELLKHNKINKEDVLKEQKLKKLITSDGNYRGAYYLEEYNLYVATSFSMNDIIRNIEKVLAYAEVDNNQVIISFKA